MTILESYAAGRIHKNFRGCKRAIHSLTLSRCELDVGNNLRATALGEGTPGLGRPPFIAEHLDHETPQSGKHLQTIGYLEHQSIICGKSHQV